MNFQFLVLVIAVLRFGRSTELQGRIFNGYDASPDLFRFMALLKPQETICCGLISADIMCGGAVIGSRWVLTAAHCVDGMSRVNVFFGAVTADDIEHGFVVRKNAIVVHPEWDDVNSVNDVALLRIPPTEECDKVAFARLPFHMMDFAESMFTDQSVIAMGWGDTGDNGDKPDRLKWTHMELMSNDDCLSVVNYTTNRELCGRTTPPFGSTCVGDSGGPLLLRSSFTLIGVASSFASDSCEAGSPVIFMRVTSFLPWITRTTGIHN